MGLPKGWLDYNRVGNKVHGTRFIAFKVPLKEGVNRACNVDEEKQLYPKLLVELIPNLGLIIDLTNTTKYYHPDEFSKFGIKYEKIPVVGQVVPKNECYIQFKNAVNHFLANNPNDKLIGVHCTHGLNRSGFLICRYMIEALKIQPLEAIAAFELARGHKMERDNYIDKLKCLNDNGVKIPKIASLAIDTETEKGTQTHRGYWIDERNIAQNQRTSTGSNTSFEASEQKQVQLVGCVNVQRRNLIPDGTGNYFVRVMKKDIKRHEPPSRREPYQMPQSIHRNDRIHPRKRSHQNIPSQRQYHHHQPRPNAPYPPRPPQIHHTENPMFVNNSLPVGGNNLAENLLRMQHVNTMHIRGGRPNQPF
ncbi:mRNA-capping enzyme [Contarinia nasturtii]|uniref:mRNA-capping enzyme n=1 Tax=Contarinia nasturtii TaxID=265458 RepID=UPI0012D3E86B|nr:mRNA-capping enzyme [Contarinia nasturtii]